ncbi:extracellular catalytic domain type 1 short-chain-length polyhydroxyalkanoate depolymerase [Granulicoccus sp. GXG6511]|uniref:extracellular catalytic domain type 1 short-chain-length polyhydroxyalkanoate depolymerase n=1 Tax=Granulicoccus sp. GXG6511 TaxID=3381351 RepID=UPI003D7E2D5C
MSARRRTQVSFGGGWGTIHRQPHTGLPWSRGFTVYVPYGLRRTSPAPLLMALHGCNQTAEDFAAITRFNQLADRHQFLVVYPEQARINNAQRCWNWAQAQNQTRYGGEPGSLAGIVQRMIKDRTRWRVDPARVYAVGMSAGGTMAMTLGATYPDLFAGVGVHSAPPFKSAATPAHALSAMQGLLLPPPPPRLPQTQVLPPTVVFQGTLDGTVWPKNAQRIADQWLAHHDQAAGIGMRRRVGDPRAVRRPMASPHTRTSRRGYSVRRWQAGRERMLELWLVDGLGHAWCGGAGDFAFSDRRGPRASTEMWRFLSKHSLPV